MTPSLISWMRSWRGSFSAMDRGFVEVGVGDLVDAVVQILGVLREELEFLGFLRGDLLELGLGLADHLDERLGGFKTAGDDSSSGLVWPSS